MIPVLALLLGCPAGTQCVDRGDCGDLQMCNNGNCKDVSCSTSKDCGIGEYCDTTGNFECKAGCTTDDDCLAGEACNADNHTCEEYECRTTALDCGLGERCDNGRCDDALGMACDPCNDPLYYDYWTGGYTGGTGCGNNGTCVWFTYYADAPWCLEQCIPSQGEEACPRGFSCEDITGDNDYHCYAWCPSVNYELSHPEN